MAKNENRDTKYREYVDLSSKIQGRKKSLTEKEKIHYTKKKSTKLQSICEFGNYKKKYNSKCLYYNKLVIFFFSISFVTDQNRIQNSNSNNFLFSGDYY